MKVGPAVLLLDLTNHCNFRCEFCFQHGDLTARKGVMDTDLALRVIDQSVDAGIATEVATSVFGEALMHPEFFRIADHAVKRGLTVSVNTKGGTLDTETARRLFDVGVHTLIISLNTPDEKSWQVNHGPPGLDFAGHLRRIEQTLEQKVASGARTHVYLYAMNTHFSRPRGLAFIEDHATALKVLSEWREVCAGIASRHGKPLPPSLEQLAGGEDLVKRKWPVDQGVVLLPGIELVFKEGHMWGNRMLEPGLEVVPATRGFCPLPWVQVVVQWNGDCSICCLDYNRDFVVGNVRDMTVAEVFHGPALQQVRARMAAGHIDHPMCQACLGAVRDKATGEIVRRATASKLDRVLASVEKYGVSRSLSYLWRFVKEKGPGVSTFFNR